MHLSPGAAGTSGPGGSISDRFGHGRRSRPWRCGSNRLLLTMRHAVFLDRDGTIIEDRDYLCDPREIELIPGAAKALRLLNRLHMPVVLISNQSGIGRGYISNEQHESVHEAFVRILRNNDCFIDAAYYCPHVPQDHCACRKPKSGMLRTAASELGLFLEGSFLVGDRMSDVEAGKRVGTRTALVLTGHGRQLLPWIDLSKWPDFVGDDVLAAALWIERMVRSHRPTRNSRELSK